MSINTLNETIEAARIQGAATALIIAVRRGWIAGGVSDEALADLAHGVNEYHKRLLTAEVDNEDSRNQREG